MRIDSFSGAAADLKGKARTPEMILEKLKLSPRVSTFDMSEHRWLDNGIQALIQQGLIEAVAEPYPWHRYKITEKGNQQ